jgi:hypothetical protein
MTRRHEHRDDGRHTSGHAASPADRVGTLPPPESVGVDAAALSDGAATVLAAGERAALPAGDLAALADGAAGDGVADGTASGDGAGDDVADGDASRAGATSMNSERSKRRSLLDVEYWCTCPSRQCSAPGREE